MEKRRKKKNMKKKKNEEAVLPKVYIDGESPFLYADILKLGLQPAKEPRSAIKYVLSTYQKEVEQKEEPKNVLPKNPKSQNPWYIIKENESLKIIKRDVFKKTISKEAVKTEIPSERKTCLYLGNIKNSTFTGKEKISGNGKKKGSSANVNCIVLRKAKKERIAVPATTVPHLQRSIFVVGPISSGQLSEWEDIIY